MKKLPTGISTFSEIIEDRYIYVDKTQYIHKMISTGKIFFLSRPRRFGKSLFVSTLEELFKGNKELFKGLYIYDKWNWSENYPVVKISLGKGNFDTEEELENILDETINRLAREFSVKIYSKTISGKFTDLIMEIYKKKNKKVVVLIDEYDFPIMDSIKNIKIAQKNQQVLSGFYRVLKDCDEYLRFIFLTGVTKFSKTSVFSGLNNLDDISLNDDFSCICGYTHQDLRDSFKDYLKILKEKLSLTDKKTIDKINYWYDGYSWNGKNKVYNPFSTLKLFRSNDFSDYWFETATPKFLITVLKNSKNYNDVLKPIIVKQSRFKIYDYNKLDPITVFFQTGYLTIVEKMIINDTIHYKLEFPNFEVENSLLDHLMDLNLSKEKIDQRKGRIISQIVELDNESFQKEMKSFLAHIPNRIHIEREGYYQSIFLAWLYALGFEIEGETPTNTGYSDMVLKEEDFVVVAEFKFSKLKKESDQPVKSFDKMLKEAIKQIKDKKYYEKYTSKKIIAIAIAFAGKQLQTQITTIE